MLREAKLAVFPESRENPSVELVVKFLRHGERNPDNNALLDYGRQVTRKRARESGLTSAEFDAIKPYGSNADPNGPKGEGRALETARIYAEEVGNKGGRVLKTRKRDLLDYHFLKTPIPFDYKPVYDSLLPENFEQLSDKEKAIATAKAQAGTIEYLEALTTVEAEAYKNEAAGAHAQVLMHVIGLGERLDSGSRVFLPHGGHGGVMEFLFQKALVWTDADGTERKGYTKTSEIGGAIMPSEAVTIVLRVKKSQPRKRGTLPEIETMQVQFDNPERPVRKAYLDIDIVKKLAEEHTQLHSLK